MSEKLKNVVSAQMQFSLHLKLFGLAVTNVPALLYWLFSLSLPPYDLMGCRRQRLDSESDAIFGCHSDSSRHHKIFISIGAF